MSKPHKPIYFKADTIKPRKYVSFNLEKNIIYHIELKDPCRDGLIWQLEAMRRLHEEKHNLTMNSLI